MPADRMAAPCISAVMFPPPVARISSKAATMEMKHTTAVQAMGGRQSMTKSKMGTNTMETTIRFANSNTSKPPGAILIGCQRPIELLFGEIRPEHIGKVEFCIGRLPEQEVGDAHFPAGTDNQVRVWNVC